MERVKNIAQHVTGGGDVRSASFVDELATLAALFREGLLSESEYAAGKQKLLAPAAAPAAEGNALVSQEVAAAGTAQPVEMTDQEKFLYDLYAQPPSPHPIPPLVSAAGDSSSPFVRGAGKASFTFRVTSPPKRSRG
eukprot:SAG22_NODE_121_length_19129_cov_36.644614_16_plen_137_part_00